MLRRLCGLLALPLLLSWLPLAAALEPLYPQLSSGEAQQIARPALRHPVADEVLYFLIPDRFHDGLDDNDCGAFAGQCQEGAGEEQVLEHGFLPSDRGFYHGGDIKGLMERLDYLTGLGVTALWVGPIFENKPVQQDITNLYGHSSAYHGYWITDFMQVDPHLGSNDDFKALVAAAHEQGVKVFMDIITNHTADVIKYAEGEYGYRSKEEFPYQTAEGEPFNDAEYAYQGQEDYDFPELDLESFPYTPVVPEAEQGSKNPEWLNDPLLYHNRGDTSFTGENSLYGDFFGLDDLFTERKEVVEGMIDIYRYWVETFKPDGFRIDTTKHVNMEFWQVFGPAIVGAAADSGTPHFFAFGEVYNTQPLFLSEFSTRGRLQSTIDFAFQEAARDFASRSAPTDQLQDFFAADDYYLDADSNAYAMPTFLGNHDMGRIGYFLQRQDQPEADDSELLARSRLAHGLMYFSRGQPVIYYGDEQGFVGDGGDKLARQNMFESQVPEYNDDDLIGTDATTAEVNFDPEHPLYQALAQFGQLYRDHAALRRGAQIHRFSEDQAGVYAFSRIDREEKVEYLVALNNGEEARTVTLPTFYGEGVSFEPLLASEEGSLSTDGQGQLEVTVPPLEVAIYRASQPLSPSEQAPGITLTVPSGGEAVTLLEQSIDGVEVIEPLEVRAELEGAGLAEVSFAVSVDGGPWQYLGTDDHPPYRVFYRVYETPNEASLDFRAVVSDLNGHLNMASVEDVSFTVEQPVVEPLHDSVVIHYIRPDGDYGDPSSGDYNDYWGLHLWGEAIAPEAATQWTSPRPFTEEGSCGRYTQVELVNDTKPVNFIVHKGDNKDATDADRSFHPRNDAPEVWLVAGDDQVYTQPPEGCEPILKPEHEEVVIHYVRPAKDYGNPESGDYNDYWGLHLWGDAIDPAAATEWTAPRPFLEEDACGVYTRVELASDLQPVNFIVHKGDLKDATEQDRSFHPRLDGAEVWLVANDPAIRTDPPAGCPRQLQ